jgi:hypothetical protein
MLTFVPPSRVHRFISRYFSCVPSFRVAQLLPSCRTLVGCGLVSAALAASNVALMAPRQLAAAGFWHQAGQHVGVGVACLVALGAWVWVSERQTLRQVPQLRRGGTQEESEDRKRE